MSGLEDLYREIILDHYRSPRNRGELETPPAHRAEGLNPLCGDEIVVYIALDGEGSDEHRIVSDIKIGGQGCSISQSSASMMSAAVKGKSLAQIRDLTRTFKSMMSIHEASLDVEGDTEDEPDLLDPTAVGKTLGDLEALRGVVKFPVRIKCATLSWNTLEQSIAEALSEPTHDAPT